MQEKIIKIITDTLGVNADKITETTSFTDDLNADSLDLLELATALEDEFGIEISDEELEEIKTVGDVIDYVKKSQE